MKDMKNIDMALSSIRSDVADAIRRLEDAEDDLARINVPELEDAVKMWRECLEAGLQTIVAKYGESSREAAVIRDMLK